MTVKTAFSTDGRSIDDPIAPAFGRCRNFVIVESGYEPVKVIPNPGTASAGGAGVQAAETLVRAGIVRLVTGSIGYNARPIFDAAGIEIVTGASGPIRDYFGSAAAPAAVIHREGPPPPARGGPPQAGVGRNPEGFCACRQCGYRTEDDSGLPCFKLTCPDCGAGMERRFA
jgi:predicted Fe-Mo cluster-binding NifX family protein